MVTATELDRWREAGGTVEEKTTGKRATKTWVLEGARHASSYCLIPHPHRAKGLDSRSCMNCGHTPPTALLPTSSTPCTCAVCLQASASGPGRTHAPSWRQVLPRTPSRPTVSHFACLLSHPLPETGVPCSGTRQLGVCLSVCSAVCL